MTKDSIGKIYRKKFFNDQYELVLPHYNSNESKVFLIVGDIHYHEHAPKQVFQNLMENVQSIKPDYIILPGDTIETLDFLNDNKEKTFFEYMIITLASVAPLVISAGNHEIANFNTGLDRSSTVKTLEYFENLSKLPNVYFLHNKQVKIDNVTFTGFTPSLNYYFNYNSKNSKKISYQEYEDSKLKMNKKDFNVLISHVVPIDFADRDKTDLTIAGHWHDGLIPKILDRFFKDTNKGIFFEEFPQKRSTKVEYARGVSEFGRGYAIVTQGYRKNTADIKLFNILERIAANDIETIIVQKGITKSKKH